MIREEAKSQFEFIRKTQEEAASYSPGTVKLLDLAVNYIQDAEKAYKEGKQAVWCFGSWEAPICYATGNIPVSFTELGRLSNPDSLLISEDHFQVPKDICTMVSVLLGEWYLRKDGIHRLLGFNGDCEAFNSAWELLKQEGYEVHRIENSYITSTLTQEQIDERIHFLADQIHIAARWLNYGEEPDIEKIKEEIRRKNRVLHKVHKIMDYRIQNPLFLKSIGTLYLIIGSGHYFGKPQEYEEALDMIISEMERDEYHPDASGIIPLVWTGGRGQEFGIYKAIDDLGGSILGWVVPTPFAGHYREDVDPYESIARFVLLSGESDANSLINYIDAIDEQVTKSNARGVLTYNYVGCSIGGVRTEYQREYFHKKGIPALSVDGNFMVGPASGQLLTRIKAFIEMLS